MNKIKMGIAIGILSTVMQLWHPLKGYSDGYYLDNQYNQSCYNDQCYCFRPFLDYIAFDGGYRWDRVIDMGALEGTLYGSSSELFENLSSVQFGAKGAISFCGNWYLRGRGHYGLITDGLVDTQIAYAHLKGYTWDVEGAAGYLFDCFNCLGIAPVVGYSYDKLHFAQYGYATEFYHFDSTGFGNVGAHEKYNYKWYGVFIGTDFLFNGCNWAFDASYELHFGHAKERQYNVPLSVAYADPPVIYGTNKHMLGHVWRLEGLVPVGCGWTLGFGLEYTYWANKRRSTQINVDAAAYGEGGVKFYDDRLQWHSFLTTIDVGYTF